MEGRYVVDYIENVSIVCNIGINIKYFQQEILF